MRNRADLVMYSHMIGQIDSGNQGSTALNMASCLMELISFFGRCGIPPLVS